MSPLCWCNALLPDSCWLPANTRWYLGVYESRDFLFNHQCTGIASLCALISLSHEPKNWQIKQLQFKVEVKSATYPHSSFHLVSVCSLSNRHKCHCPHNDEHISLKKRNKVLITDHCFCEIKSVRSENVCLLARYTIPLHWSFNTELSPLSSVSALCGTVRGKNINLHVYFSHVNTLCLYF